LREIALLIQILGANMTNVWDTKVVEKGQMWSEVMADGRRTSPGKTYRPCHAAALQAFSLRIRHLRNKHVS